MCMHTSAKAGRWVWPSAGQCNAMKPCQCSCVKWHSNKNGSDAHIFIYCQPADSMLDSNGPLSRTIAPSFHARLYVCTAIKTRVITSSSVGPLPQHRWYRAQSRKLIPRILILKAHFDFSRNLAPPKITRHTVLHVLYMWALGLIGLPWQLDFNLANDVHVCRYVHGDKLIYSPKCQIFCNIRTCRSYMYIYMYLHIR